MDDLLASLDVLQADATDDNYKVVAEDLRSLGEAANRSGNDDISAAADEARARWAEFQAHDRSNPSHPRVPPSAERARIYRAAVEPMQKIEDACADQ